MTAYRTIVADPPWKFGDSLPGKGRGASSHYECMGVADICALGEWVREVAAPDSLLFLWRVASMQREALDVMDAWGFDLKSEIVWRKLTCTGKRAFGMGRYVRNEHEVCLIGRRGRAATQDHSIRSTFEAPVGRHSEKPAEFYALVERLHPGPYLELFARGERPGWIVWGHEVAA